MRIREFLKPGSLSVKRGKYIARCDGDDFGWSPLKLQRQVDLLESDLIANGPIQILIFMVKMGYVF